MRASNAIYWTFRIALGVLILGAGVGKALDIAGFVTVMRTYRLPIPENSYWLFSYGTIVFELVLGLWVLSGIRLAMASALSVAMHAGYFVLLSSALARGLNLDNCGCFGVFLARPLRWYSPLEDLALIAVSFILLVLARRGTRTIPPDTRAGREMTAS